MKIMSRYVSFLVFAVCTFLGIASCQTAMPLPNGNFELADDSSSPGTILSDDSNFPANYSTTSDANGIADWRVVANGVQLLSNGVYYPAPSDPNSQLCLHLNRPGKDATSQGTIQTSLSFIPALNAVYTISFDFARNPDADDGLDISMEHRLLMNRRLMQSGVHRPIMNISDTPSYISWSTDTVTFVGLSVPAVLQFRSLSIGYGCLVDNVNANQIA